MKNNTSRENKLTFNFSDEDYQNPSLMTQFTKVTNYQTVIELEIENKWYDLHDSYCKNIDCHCTEVNFDLVRNEGGKIAEILKFSYDYKTRVFTKMPEPQPTEIVQFVKQNKALHEIFELRNKMIRLEFDNFLLKKSIAQNRKTLSLFRVNKQPRNAPCACGSGKKFKHCCDK